MENGLHLNHPNIQASKHSNNQTTKQSSNQAIIYNTNFHLFIFIHVTQNRKSYQKIQGPGRCQ